MKKVTIAVPSGKVNLASITGSFEILHRANTSWKKQGNQSMMEITVAGFVPELVLDAGFFSIHPADIRTVSKTDLLIIPAVGFDSNLVKENAALITWIRQQYKAGAEIVTMCSGAFLLAATGLLDGKSCSTHWNLANKFRNLFPEVNLLTDKLITADKGIYTNGGAYSF